MAVHLGYCNISVPVRWPVTVTGEGDAVNPREAVGGRNHRRVILSVEVEARVIFAWTPGAVDGLLLRGDRRREGNDRAWVELAVRPTVEPLADPGLDRVVHRGVTESAGNPDPGER